MDLVSASCAYDSWYLSLGLLEGVGVSHFVIKYHFYISTSVLFNCPHITTGVQGALVKPVLVCVLIRRHLFFSLVALSYF